MEPFDPDREALTGDRIPTVGEVLDEQVLPDIARRAAEVNARYWYEWQAYFNGRVRRLFEDGYSEEEASWLVAEEAKTVIPKMNARMRAELKAHENGETA